MNLSCCAPSLNPTQLLRMKNINLTNYYHNYPELCIVYCKICQLDVQPNVFEHTASKQHKYNKVLIAIVQGCSRNADTDFKILDIDMLQCRYCHTVIVSLHGDDQIDDHIREAGHLEKKNDHLNAINASKTLAAQFKLLQPLESLIVHDNNYKKCISKTVNSNAQNKSSAQVLKQPPVKLEAAKNGDQFSVDRFSALRRDYRKQKGMELPYFIVLGKRGSCNCTVCQISVPTCYYNVNGHIDGKKHRQKMQELAEARNKTSECPSTSGQEYYAEESEDWEDGDSDEIDHDDEYDEECSEEESYDYEEEDEECSEEESYDYEEDEECSEEESCDYEEDEEEEEDCSDDGPDEDSIIEIDGVWACIVCRTALLSEDDVEEHIESEYHEMNIQEEDKLLVGYEDIEQLWVCQVCERLLHKHWMDVHIKSKVHRSNM